MEGTTLKLTLKADNTEPNPLDEAIDRLFNSMQKMHPASEEYSNTADQLLKLHKRRDESTSSKRVSPDTLAVIAGNLVGIVAILGYEKTGAITSRALGFVMKLAK